MRTVVLLFLSSLYAAHVHLTVCPSGCTHTTIQAAYDTAAAGASGDDYLIDVAVATYTSSGEVLLIRANTSRSIYLRSANFRALPARGFRVAPADAVNMPKLTTSSTLNVPPVRTSQTASCAPPHDVTIDGFEITLAGTGQNFASRLMHIGGLGAFESECNNTSHDRTPKRFRLYRSYIHGLLDDNGPLGILQLGVEGFVAEDNYFERAQRTDQESSVVFAQQGSIYSFRNNYVGDGAISSLVGGAGTLIAGHVPHGWHWLGNHFRKNPRYQRILAPHDPIGTTLPGSSSGGLTFWNSNTSEFNVYSNQWAVVSNVASNAVCLSGAFWVNTTASTYWECQSGNWISVGSDRAIAAANGQFQWWMKNLWEVKNVVNSVARGNVLENGIWPTIQAQIGACVLTNWTNFQNRYWGSLREVVFEDNDCRHVTAGVQNGGIPNGIALTTITNANPAVVTHGSDGGSSYVYAVSIEGCTGAWSALNGTWTPTWVSNSTWSIPVDSTTFGPSAGCKWQDMTLIGFRHQQPRNIRVANNRFLTSQFNLPMRAINGTSQTTPTVGITNDGAGANGNTLFGRMGFVQFDGYEFHHNTSIKPNVSTSWRATNAFFLDPQPRPGWYSANDRRHSRMRLMNNLNDGSYGSATYFSGSSTTSCDAAAASVLQQPYKIGRNVAIGVGIATAGLSGATKTNCAEIASTWVRSGSGTRGAVTSASLSSTLTSCPSGSGDRCLTINFAGSPAGHGLVGSSRFTISGATPADVNGTYTMPQTRCGSGTATEATDNQLCIRLTSASTGTVSGITITADAGFQDYAAGNYRLASSSLYKRWASDGADPGADHDKIDWAIAGAENGSPNPYLDMGLRAWLAAAAGGTLRFTSYSATACTVQVAAYNDRSFQSPLAASVSVTQAGRDGSATISGLSASTPYWYRLTCDGRYRDGEIATLAP